MDALHQLEINLIVFIQSLTVFLAQPMRMISMLGQEEFYMLIMPALYWSVDAGLGIRIGIMLLLSNELNSIAKLAFHLPRPYWISDQVKTFTSEISFGMPSGHAQHAASIWGLLAVSVRQTWLRVTLVVLIFLIGFSRIVLGMHFISDVAAGWVIGGLTVVIFISIERPIVSWLRSRSLWQMLGLALVTSILMVWLVLLTSALSGDAAVPEAWKQAALAAQPGNVIDPFNINGAFTIAGTWFGLLAGAAWLYHRQEGYDASGTPEQRLMRYLIGVVGIFLFYYGLGMIFPRSPDALSYGLRFARYTLVGGWISGLAPLMFERLGLAKSPQKQVPSLSVPQNPL
jgi:membrane-associated phospholipid phosphatase